MKPQSKYEANMAKRIYKRNFISYILLAENLIYILYVFSNIKPDGEV